MRLYHYTTNLKGITEGSKESNHIPKLLMPGELIITLGSKTPKEFIFVLPGPEPKEWVKNIVFQVDILEQFRQMNNAFGRHMVLLDINAAKLPVSLGDYAYRHAHQLLEAGIPIPNLPDRYKIYSEKEANEAYINSFIPYESWERQVTETGYIIPELVIQTKNPLLLGDRVHVSDQQPLLSRELMEADTSNRLALLEAIHLNAPKHLYSWHESQLLALREHGETNTGMFK